MKINLEIILRMYVANRFFCFVFVITRSFHLEIYVALLVDSLHSLFWLIRKRFFDQNCCAFQEG